MIELTLIVILALIGIGLFAGIGSGILGIGGGLIIVPCLVYFMKMTQHQAQGTTLALMLPPITLMSTYVYWKAGHVNLKVTLFVCIGFFIGSYFGGKVAVALSSLALKRAFAIFLIGVSVHMLFSKKPQQPEEQTTQSVTSEESILEAPQFPEIGNVTDGFKVTDE